jgi:hypothetical protein
LFEVAWVARQGDMAKSEYEQLLWEQLARSPSSLPLPERDARFHDSRRWRFDFYWPSYRVAVEVEGGVWVRGRHTRASGFVGDLEKYNEAALQGIALLRVTPAMVRSGEALALIRRFFSLSTVIAT